MIGLYQHWSREPLAAPLVDRFAASLGIGKTGGMGVRTIDGATLASSTSDPRRAKSWAPARTANGNFSLLQGHIDNRAELIRMLPRACDPSCDTATLYSLCHEAWGDACDLKIIGQYSSIIWSPDSATIRIARSPIQAPALHIWRDKDRVIISSTARSIFATGDVKQELDEQKIADSLFLNYAEEARGWFKGVARLPIGSQATITREGQSTKRYYDPFARDPIRFTRDEEYVEAADALFEEGTRAALQGFSRPAVSLSGGYDSQAVAAYALRVMPDNGRLLGLTSVPASGWDQRVGRNRFGDEREHVKALAAMYPRMDVELVDAAGLGLDHKLDAMFLIAGTAPRNASNLYWVHEVHARAKAAGCDVILSGDMGNATFSFDGSGAISSWFLNGQWGRVGRELWAARAGHKSFAHAVAANLVRPFLPAVVSDLLDNIRHGRSAGMFETWCPMNSAWAADMNVEARAAAAGFNPTSTSFRSTHAWRAAVIDNAFNEGGDIYNAIDTIAGIPSRDPTSYRPLLEFCFAIPDDQYLRGGKKRWLAKRLLKGMVPDMVLNETRRGLQAADWHMRFSHQKRDMIAEIDRLSGDPKMSAMLNLPRLRKALDEWPAETPVDDIEILQTIQLALSRGLSTARFVRYFEGTNA